MRCHDSAVSCVMLTDLVSCIVLHHESDGELLDSIFQSIIFCTSDSTVITSLLTVNCPYLGTCAVLIKSMAETHINSVKQ